MLKETEKRKGKSVSNFMSLLVKKSYQKKIVIIVCPIAFHASYITFVEVITMFFRT